MAIVRLSLQFWMYSVICICAFGSDVPVRRATGIPLRHCGEEAATLYVPDAPSPRACDNSPHKYKPKHHGLGFEILDSESQACGVSDQEYALLDEIIDKVLSRAKYVNTLTDVEARHYQAQQISTIISDVLNGMGFAIHIPTVTLSDALFNRKPPGTQPQQLMDCDTGSFIYLTVAENLGAPLALVDITIDEDIGHNYVRWDLGQSATMDWDTNGAAECRTPDNLPPYQGRSMSRGETLGYALSLRAYVWASNGKYDLAANDYHNSILLYPQSPTAYNSFAWMIATKDFIGRKARVQEAIDVAEKAISINRAADYIDTAACAYALGGNFVLARQREEEALTLKPDNADFAARLKQFGPDIAKDCTGAK